MILEINNYTTLEAIALDITDAANANPNNMFDATSPMKVELPKEELAKVLGDLKAFASYPGIRSMNEFPSIKWQVSGYHVVFMQKKD